MLTTRVNTMLGQLRCCVQQISTKYDYDSMLHTSLLTWTLLDVFALPALDGPRPTCETTHAPAGTSNCPVIWRLPMCDLTGCLTSALALVLLTWAVITVVMIFTGSSPSCSLSATTSSTFVTALTTFCEISLAAAWNNTRSFSYIC